MTWRKLVSNVYNFGMMMHDWFQIKLNGESDPYN